ncbi:hypothetical protein BU15DRAFT_49006 [Melanogaster broomeanus]|nr:hypothetical protein BU15DRAFT_56616 [Melanogaster broomeanus]KAF9237203.1 hypothetical protein BU15DRAFT_49006 [Melanogaster broomeanus]
MGRKCATATSARASLSLFVNHPLIVYSKPSRPIALVAEVTTLRRHMESTHRAEYLQWAEANNFPSMLPKDAKQRKEGASSHNQPRLDSHLQPKERVIPYSDKMFRDAAIQWLIDTDQPIAALEHPSFKNMIDVAARATNGVKIPNRKATRQAIIDSFKQQMTNLRARLSVCNSNY